MKNRALLIILILGLQLLGFSQKTSQNMVDSFGKVSQEELEMAYYEKDKSAEAVVLFDIGKSYFDQKDNSFNIIYSRTRRIKIFSEAGIKYAEVEIPFYNKNGIYEKVFDIEAYSYNDKDGQVIKTALDLKNTYVKKTSSSWSEKTFAIPAVKAGSVIEYRYKVSTTYKSRLRDWQFQSRIPTIYSEYQVKMIPFYTYNFLLQGARGFDTRTSYVDKGLPKSYYSAKYHEKVFQFGMKDVPAFKSEKFITSMNDYVIQLDFQLSKYTNVEGTSTKVMTTWPDMINDLRKEKIFGKYIKTSKKIAPQLIHDQLEGKTEKEKFDFLIDYVKTNFSHNHRRDKYASKTPKKFIADKIGNSADINLFTIGLLRAYGIEAYPVIISTRSHGIIKYEYPYYHFFNYVIISAYVDGQEILTDATNKYLKNDRIPWKCINDKGLLIKKGVVEWVHLQRPFSSERKTEIAISFKEEKLNASLKIKHNEYDAAKLRDEIDGSEQRYLDEILRNIDFYVDSSLHISNLMNIEEPLIIEYQFRKIATRMNGKIYIPPFLGETIGDNPLKQDSRNYPIDMVYSKKREFVSVIAIPEAYKVSFLPEEEHIENAKFELDYQVNSSADSVQISFSYHFKKPVYSAADYSKIKFYFTQIVKKGQEKIVLEKE